MNIGESVSQTQVGETSQDKLSSVKGSGPLHNSNSNAQPINDFVSDNASVINQPMKNADKEDYNMTMQKGNPMRESIGRGGIKQK